MKLKRFEKLSLALVMCAFVFGSVQMGHLIEASASTTLVSATTRLYVNPPSIVDPEKTPGTSFTVDINVENVVDLYTWAFVLNWDPAMLNVTGVAEGPFLAEVAPEGTFLINKTYQDAGYIDEACSILGDYYGAEGNGTLLTVTFLVEAVGETALDLSQTSLINSQDPPTPIEHIVDDGYFSNIPQEIPPIVIYTDKYTYSTGDTMHLGLNVTNPLDHPITVCIAIWIELPNHSTRLVQHAHAVTLPVGFHYYDPDYKTVVLPSIPLGVYTWHAAFLNPTNHNILIEDTAQWEFV